MEFCPFEIETTWKTALKDELAKPYIIQLAAFIEKERMGAKPIYPPANLVFNAFLQTPLPQVKVVIVGQDPYHRPNQAHGLSFSVPEGVPLPPSLKNIYQELKEDLQIPISNKGCLLPWAKQGVLLLNALLTVREGEPLSHKNRGWEMFTDKVIGLISERDQPIVFLLWGRPAQDKFKFSGANLKHPKHLILTAPHPSPLSAYQGFFGCKHFSKTNEFLIKNGKAPIDWRV